MVLVTIENDDQGPSLIYVGDFYMIARHVWVHRVRCAAPLSVKHMCRRG
jgi:hypothetical protein